MAISHQERVNECDMAAQTTRPEVYWQWFAATGRTLFQVRGFQLVAAGVCITLAYDSCPSYAFSWLRCVSLHLRGRGGPPEIELVSVVAN